MNQFNLSGKTAIVTGANGGIGRGVALALAEAGANVCIAGRNEKKNEEVRMEVDGLGASVIAQTCDVSDDASITEAIEVTVDAFGGLNILVNNAGIITLNSPEAVTDEEWMSVIDTNLNGVFKFCRAAYGPLKKAGGGKIINIGSMYSIFGSPFAASYAASKGAVVQLSKSLAVSWAGDNIQVNTILPGWIETDMTAPIESNMADLHAAIMARTPAGRFGRSEEIGGTAVYLASSASDFVTGQSIPVCGGYSIA